MPGTGRAPKAYRFGVFELDVGPGELRKHGTRIKLQEQPLQILVLLLEHAGELVTREQIQNRLWPPGTYVDYDNAINSAMRKLREALGDASEIPAPSKLSRAGDIDSSSRWTRRPHPHSCLRPHNGNRERDSLPERAARSCWLQ